MNKRGGIWVKEVERFEQVHLIEYTQSSCGPSFLLQLNSASQACLFPFNQLTLLVHTLKSRVHPGSEPLLSNSSQLNEKTTTLLPV